MSTGLSFEASFAPCFRKFQSRWTSWAGWPRVVAPDRGLHNRGAFAKGLAGNGVYFRQAPLENLEAIGRDAESLFGVCSQFEE